MTKRLSQFLYFVTEDCMSQYWYKKHKFCHMYYFAKSTVDVTFVDDIVGSDVVWPTTGLLDSNCLASKIKLAFVS